MVIERLQRWADRRMYAKLRDLYLFDALYSWRNVVLEPGRAEWWRERCERYLDRSWEYETKRRET